MQGAGKDAGGQDVADVVIGKRGAVALAVGAPALAPGFWGISGLVDGGDSGDEGDGEEVVGSGGGQVEFFKTGKRRRGLAVFDGAVVGQDGEDAVVGGARVFAGGGSGFRMA